jgi:hypothetical protein
MLLWRSILGLSCSSPRNLLLGLTSQYRLRSHLSSGQSFSSDARDSDRPTVRPYLTGFSQRLSVVLFTVHLSFAMNIDACSRHASRPVPTRPVPSRPVSSAAAPSCSLIRSWDATDVHSRQSSVCRLSFPRRWPRGGACIGSCCRIRNQQTEAECRR